MFDKQILDVRILAGLTYKVKADNAAWNITGCNLSEKDVEPHQWYRLITTVHSEHKSREEVIYDTVGVGPVDAGKALCPDSVFGMLKHDPTSMAKP
jgi:hypothetical protein